MKLKKTHFLIQKKLKKKLNSLSRKIFKISDRIAQIFRLEDAKSRELLFFPKDQSYRIAFNLERFRVRAILLSDRLNLKENDRVESTRKLASIDVKEDVLRSIVDRFGKPILKSSNKNSIKVELKNTTQNFEAAAPSILSRFPVEEAMQTRLLAVDSLIPIRRGQRELIIGDRQIGKTQIAIDTIINLTNQYKADTSKKPTICVFVAVRQKESQIAETQKKLEKVGAMDQTIIVNASASAPASMQYLAPFTRTAIAEAFMNSRYDVVITYDDLSRHAQAYREMSLLLKRPPGREAFPRDIFYVHARLLERSAKLKDSRSLTALPIIETLARDISAYIPTNVISITDRQIFLSRELFNQRIRPAIDVRLSVSRVRSAAQPKNIKKLAGKLKLILAQYRELKVFTQFSSDLDAESQSQLDARDRLTKLFVQPPSKPCSEPLEFALLYAYETIFNEVPTDEISSKITAFIDAFDRNESLVKFNQTYFSNIDEAKKILDGCLKEFF